MKARHCIHTYLKLDLHHRGFDFLHDFNVYLDYSLFKTPFDPYYLIKL